MAHSHKYYLSRFLLIASFAVGLSANAIDPDCPIDFVFLPGPPSRDPNLPWPYLGEVQYHSELPIAREGQPVLAKELEYQGMPEILFALYADKEGKTLAQMNPTERMTFLTSMAEEVPIYKGIAQKVLRQERRRFNLSSDKLKALAEITIKPQHSFYFRGKYYQAGLEQIIPLKGFMEPQFEYMGVQMREMLLGMAKIPSKPSGIEMKFRGTGHPKNLDHDVQVFLNEILPALSSNTVRKKKIVHDFFADPSGDHTHVVFAIPSETFKKLQDLYPKFDEIFGLAMTSQHSLMEGHSIFHVGDHEGIGRTPNAWGYLNAEDIPKVFSFFKKMAKTGKMPTEEVKFLHTGVRRLGSEAGSFEHRRSLLEMAALPSELERVAGNQKLAENGFSDFPWEYFAKFRDEFGERSSAIIQSLWAYDRDTSQIIHAHKNDPVMKDLVERSLAKVEFGANRNRKLGVLYTNWELHPLIRYNPALMASIKKAKEGALKKIIGAGSAPHDYEIIALDFLEASGLNQVLGDRLGLGGTYTKYPKWRSIFGAMVKREVLPLEKRIRALSEENLITSFLIPSKAIERRLKPNYNTRINGILDEIEKWQISDPGFLATAQGKDILANLMEKFQAYERYMKDDFQVRNGAADMLFEAKSRFEDIFYQAKWSEGDLEQLRKNGIPLDFSREKLLENTKALKEQFWEKLIDNPANAKLKPNIVAIVNSSIQFFQGDTKNLNIFLEEFLRKMNSTRVKEEQKKDYVFSLVTFMARIREYQYAWGKNQSITKAFLNSSQRDQDEFALLFQNISR